MKNIGIYFVILTFIFTGCNKDEKEAVARLQQAISLYEQGELLSAKNEVDSIRAHYPKQLKVQLEAHELMRKVEVKEAERTIAFCDSLIPIKEEEALTLKDGFIFEMNTEFSDVGNYTWKLQSIERNVQRCYVRSRVNSKGEMFLESVFYGSRPIHHTSVRFSTTDGQFAETATIPYDGGLNYRFEDLGNTTEVVSYGGDKGVDAVKFIYAHENERIKVEYQGGKPYVIYLTDADKKAIAATYDLATVLNDIENMVTRRDKAVKRIEYLKSKL